MTNIQTLDTGKISIQQLVFILLGIVLPTADLFLPALVSHDAKYDSWISVIIGTIGSLIIVNIFITLGKRYKNQTIIQYSNEILGKWLGKCVGFLYIFFSVSLCWLVIRELAELFIIAYSPDSMIFNYSIGIVLVAAYCVYHGITAIARISELLMPVGIIILGFIITVNIPEMDLTNFLPIFLDGVFPSMKGGLLIQSWLLEIILLFQIFPLIKKSKNVRLAINISVILLGFSMLSGVLIISIFGDFTSHQLFPALELVRHTKLGNRIKDLDLLIMIFWILGIFIKVTVCYYCSVISISQFCNFKDYKSMIIPVGIFIICFSKVGIQNLAVLLNFEHYYFPFFILILAFIIPMFLLIVDILKSKLKALT